MAFVVYDENYDAVSFYKRECFTNKTEVITQYIERGNEDMLLHYIHLYMEKRNNNKEMAKIAVRRPSTPSISIGQLLY